MSIQARAELCSKLFFQDDTQKSDLMDPSLTQTQLIALLLGLVDSGWNIEITAVRTDHGPDGYLGLHSHQNGYAVDCWPLATPRSGDYYDAGSPHFADFLSDAAKSAWLQQIGLGGSAFTPANMAAAGPTAFEDNGQDHVHLGANGP